MSAPTAAAPTRRRASGRKTILLVFLVIPVAAIALLLAGPRDEHQVCLHTLQQRHRSSWAIGSLAVRSSGWEVIDEWPAIESPMAAGALAPPSRSPGETAALLWPGAEPPRLWTTTSRGMPFALVIQIENKRALPQRLKQVMEAQFAARSLLDPAEDAECLRAFDAAVLEGVVVPDDLDRRERRRYSTLPLAPGEEHALAVLTKLSAAHDAVSLGGDARGVLCTAAE